MEYRNHHRNNKYYVCKRMRLLEFLIKKGYVPIRTEPDIQNPKYNVWIYENSIELADAIEEYLIAQENRHKEWDLNGTKTP